MNKRSTTDMAYANRLQRAIRPTGFFNIKKMAADYCSAQCIMNNTESLNITAVCSVKPLNRHPCLCCAMALKFPQCVVTFFSAFTSIPKPELFDWKLCFVNDETAVFTPHIVILITVTTMSGVGA